MYIDVEMIGSKKIDSQYGCGNVGNMEDPVIGAPSPKSICTALSPYVAISVPLAALRLFPLPL